MLPDPLAVQVPPEEPTHVHVTPEMAAGSVSATMEPLTDEGPAFEATIVYRIPAPGTAVVWPSVFVMPTLACGVRESESVAVLFGVFGSVQPGGGATVTVFESDPVAAGLIVPVRV
jgi:hypothetical protein